MYGHIYIYSISLVILQYVICPYTHVIYDMDISIPYESSTFSGSYDLGAIQ